MIGMARDGWNKVRGLLEGSRIVRKEGRVFVGKGEITEEGGEMDEWDEMEVGGNVEVEEKEVGTNY
jgi:hypothetical protein